MTGVLLKMNTQNTPTTIIKISTQAFMGKTLMGKTPGKDCFPRASKTLSQKIPTLHSNLDLGLLALQHMRKQMSNVEDIKSLWRFVTENAHISIQRALFCSYAVLL